MWPFSKKSREKRREKKENKLRRAAEGFDLRESEERGEHRVYVEEIHDVDREKLVEITDKELLTRVNKLVPGLFKEASTVSATAMKSQAMYQLALPGTKAITVSGGLSLVAVNSSAALVTGGASAVINLASMIVGQYYMSKIDARLNTLNDSINKISDFQNNEYRSRVFALMAQVKKVATFHLETLENKELREAEIAKLDLLEQQCIELLGQANLTIEDIAAKEHVGFNKYENELTGVQKWLVYQNILIELLYKISDLIYTLNLGAVSREKCNALLDIYVKQAEDARLALIKWHETEIDGLGVDLNLERRKRDGMDGLLHWFLALFKEEKKYKPLSKETVGLIETQTVFDGFATSDTADLFAENVSIILENDKVYYLPPPDISAEASAEKASEPPSEVPSERTDSASAEETMSVSAEDFESASSGESERTFAKSPAFGEE